MKNIKLIFSSILLMVISVQNVSSSTLVEIIPQSVDYVGNCIPLGQNRSYGFQGYGYRNIPAFELHTGDKIRFDLGRLNDVNTQRDIYFSATTNNAATGWVKVTSESDIPLNPKGNTTRGDFELTYTAIADFSFPGGGLAVGFSGNPPATFFDGGCEQVGVNTSANDGSNLFAYSFYNRPHLTTGYLPRRSSVVGGMILELADIITNDPPVANAGTDQTVDESLTVFLDGSLSNDPDGDTIFYSWLQTGGVSVGLSNANSVTPSFMAPYVASSETLTFELTVDDGAELSMDSVDITVVSVNSPPLADAGDDSTLKVAASTTLDGSGSFDNEGDTIAYSWTQVSGPAVTLTPSSFVVNPQFIAPNAVGSTVIFKLQVSDGKEPSIPSAGSDSAEHDTVAVQIVENSAPISNAGVDQTKGEGIDVTLDGSASFDPDGGDAISYAWVQTGGSVTVTLDDPTSAMPMFNAPAVSAGGEDYTFELEVTDDDSFNPKSSDPDDAVVIHLTNENDPPNCDLGYASPDKLWPPNHKMKQATIDGITDADDAYPTFAIFIDSVTQDEPIDDTGDGDTSPDASIQAGAVMNGTADAVLIRAERAGNGDGRVYTINFTADDGFESCTGSTTVSVPHSRKSTAVDSGSTIDSTQ